MTIVLTVASSPPNVWSAVANKPVIGMYVVSFCCDTHLAWGLSKYNEQCMSTGILRKTSGGWMQQKWLGSSGGKGES